MDKKARKNTNDRPLKAKHQKLAYDALKFSKYFVHSQEPNHCFLFSSHVAVSSLLSRKGCNKIVKICEKSHQSACSGKGRDIESLKWSERNDYSYSTVDIEVDKSFSLKEWLLRKLFIERLQAAYRQRYGVEIISFDDMFVVKYSTELTGESESAESHTGDSNNVDNSTGAVPHGIDQHLIQNELKLHVDAGDVSFIIALSEGFGNDFTGGGTYFSRIPTDTLASHTDAGKSPSSGELRGVHEPITAEDTVIIPQTHTDSELCGDTRDLVSATIHLQQGELLTFLSRNQYHGGNAITTGTRYLLVGFAYVERVEPTCVNCHFSELFHGPGEHPSARDSGNIDLNLSLI